MSVRSPRSCTTRRAICYSLHPRTMSSTPGSRPTERGWERTTVTTEPSGRSPATVRVKGFTSERIHFPPRIKLNMSAPPVLAICTAQTKLLVSGSADNQMRLWDIASGKCLQMWEFPTAIKRVAWSDDDKRILCLTEQRSGHQGAIRVFGINREGDCSNRA